MLANEIGVNGAAARRPRKACAGAWPLAIRASRQWGRGQTAAESLIDSVVRPTAMPASMGPRPDGRGKPHRGEAVMVRGKRQWGRGQTAAESRAPLPPRGIRVCVNGAAARRPRKAGRLPDRLPQV